MSTIDQLPPASCASNDDEFMVSQAGITRKITRAQVLNGVQSQLALPGGALLGRVSTGTGEPEVINVGQNLVLNGSTLSATAIPFTINGLAGGYVPSAGDLVAMSQSGCNVAVTYGQLLSGMAAMPNLDVSQTIITPTGASSPRNLADLTASMLQASGGTVTGPLGLAGNPTTANQAANKAYVDQQNGKVLQLSGGSMNGVLMLATPPRNPMDAATKTYVDAAITGGLSSSGGSLTGPLFLSGDPTSPTQASTKGYSDQKISRTGDTLAGALMLASDPVAGLQAATKGYVDTQVSRSLAKSGDTLLGALTLASDPVGNTQAATKQYVDQRILRTGDTLTGMLGLAADPAVPNQAATKNYVDFQFGSSIARSGSSMVGSLLLASDPALPLQATTKQYVDLRLARAGDTLTGGLYLASDPTAPSQASTKQYVDSQFSTAFPKAGGSFTGPVSLAADPLVPTQAATKQYTDARLLRTGDTLTGTLALAADPVTPLQAATKNYVDRQVVACLPLSGGSVTGTLSLGTSPALPSHAATKQYVDAQFISALPLTGGTLSGAVALSAPPAAPQHAATKQYVDAQVGAALPNRGGTLTGGLTLAAAPQSPMQAATKSYVDANPNSVRVLNVTMPPFGAKLDGVTDDTFAFKAAYQAAPAGGVIYVPNGTTVLQQPESWGIALTKFVKWIVDGTTLVSGGPLAAAIPAGGAPGSLALPGVVVGHSASSLTTSQGTSQPSDFAVSQSSYIVNHSGGAAGTVATNVRSDTIIYASPANYIWGGLDRLLWAGTQSPSAATPAQHVARYIQTFRQAATAGPNGQPLPQPQLWAACLEYRDTTGQPSSATNASLTVEMDWFGNGLDDANTRRIQSLVIGQHDLGGSPVEVSNVVGVFLAGGSTGWAKTVFAIGVPFTNAVLDTTYALSKNNAPAIKLAAGQAIAFDSTNTNRLLFDAATNTLRWNQGSLSYAVGKGITVGWVNVVSNSKALPSYTAGNFVVLTGASPYTITLPAASSVAGGTGFTFSVVGSGPVTISPTGSDTIDCSPIVLRPNDRYHVVSDGSSSWREIFRTNAVSPRFTAPPILPSYTVLTLPSLATAGAKAFVSNGRKPGEAVGAGSGVEVCFDGQRWISSCSGATVTA